MEGTPPLDVVKAEDQSKVQSQNQSQSQPSTSQTIHPPAANGPLAQQTISNPSCAVLSNPRIEPELELPPRFKQILEKTLRTQSDLIHRRYLEFQHFEANFDAAAAQEADLIKL
jgi:hypothetical protein